MDYCELPSEAAINQTHLQQDQSSQKDEIEVNTRLYTKDGRVVGNAIIISVQEDDVEYRTEYGYTVASTK